MEPAGHRLTRGTTKKIVAILKFLRQDVFDVSEDVMVPVTCTQGHTLPVRKYRDRSLSQDVFDPLKPQTWPTCFVLPQPLPQGPSQTGSSGAGWVTVEFIASVRGDG